MLSIRNYVRPQTIEEAYEYAKKILEKISDENVLEDIYNQLNSEYQFSEGMLNVFKNLSKNLLNYFRVNSKQKNYCQLILKKINDINIQKDKSKQYK